MTDRGNSAKAQPFLSSSSMSTASQDNAASSVAQPRNRRNVEITNEPYLPSTTTSTAKSSGLLRSSKSHSHEDKNVALPLGSTQVESDSHGGPTGGEFAQFLGDSWTQSWTSVQAFASTLVSGGDSSSKGISSPQLRPQARRSTRQETWGPSPPSPARVDDVGIGSLARRQDALRAAKTATVLESHDGVNGGLDITGKHKRRTSEDTAPIDAQPEEQLVYVHGVEANDTYAGIILRYKCREDVFRKSNGLWSRDSVQTRKWLIIPVDSCEVKGRPCDPPSWQSGCETDLLAPTPSASRESSFVNDRPQKDYFSLPVDPFSTDTKQGQVTEDLPWSHVRWVQIDSFKRPVQIVRVRRQALGYFPPRRKRSVRTMSSVSTPRPSSDLSSLAGNTTENPTPRRSSLLSGQSQKPGTPVCFHSRGRSETTDSRPSWMRRPGGVGSMSKNVRAPGPDKDYFNSWTKKHIPGLIIEDLPSMSVMGSEMAHFGFDHGSTGIVESPFEDGRDASSASRQGTGLDRAAAAVEHWLRGALAKRPSTPLLGGRLRPAMSTDGDVNDLIELTDTASEDGKASHGVSTSMLASQYSEITGRSDRGASLKGRAKFGAEGRGAHKKDD